MERDYDNLFLEGNTYYHKDSNKHIFVMAVDTIDAEEAWLAIMYVDNEGNTTDADELCIKSDDYDNWIQKVY